MALYIWAGNRLLMSSGTVLTFGDQGTDFDVHQEGDTIRVRFEFLNDTGSPRAEYKTSPAVIHSPTSRLPATVFLRFFNMTAGGVYTDGPLKIGTIGGHTALWICYEVTPAVGSRLVKKIQYTLWQTPPTGTPDGLLESARNG
jgi:hypothetical protein